jgi:hypothetical protein
MKFVHDVQIDKNTVITTTLTIENGWLRLDHVSSGNYVGGSALRLAHVVRVEKQQAQGQDNGAYFWITLSDRDAVKTVLPFALSNEQVTQFDDALIAS